MELPEHIIFFDGVCNFCSSSVQFILHHERDKLFYFAPLQSDYAKKILADTAGNQLLPDSIIYLRKGKVYTKSDAALRICLKLNRGWSLMTIFLVIPYFIRDFFYDIIAKNRYKWFGKKDSCFIPSPEIKSRFLA